MILEIYFTLGTFVKSISIFNLYQDKYHGFVYYLTTCWRIPEHVIILLFFGDFGQFNIFVIRTCSALQIKVRFYAIYVTAHFKDNGKNVFFLCGWFIAHLKNTAYKPIMLLYYFINCSFNRKDPRQQIRTNKIMKPAFKYFEIIIALLVILGNVLIDAILILD